MDHVDAARTMEAECLCFRVRRVSRVLTRIYDEALRGLGIQATQLTLLSVVAMGGEDGNRMARMADVLVMDATTLSRNLRPLEKAGLLRIGRSETDRRIRIAKLTDEGRRLLAEALPLWRQAHAQVVGALGPEAAGDLKRRFDTTVAAAAAL